MIFIGQTRATEEQTRATEEQTRVNEKLAQAITKLASAGSICAMFVFGSPCLSFGGLLYVIQTKNSITVDCYKRL
jgi:hypothetical protein